MKFFPYLIPVITFAFFFLSCEREPPVPECDPNLSVMVASKTDTECGEAKGSINLSASGGVGSYQFQLGNGAFQSSTEFSDLTQGRHDITVKDGDECLAETSTRIRTEITLAEIVEIIDANCALPECHNGSHPEARNFTIESNITESAALIKDNVVNLIMPPSPDSLSPQQIELISCWADDQ